MIDIIVKDLGSFMLADLIISVPIYCGRAIVSDCWWGLKVILLILTLIEGGILFYFIREEVSR